MRDGGLIDWICCLTFLAIGWLICMLLLWIWPLIAIIAAVWYAANYHIGTLNKR